MMLLLMFRWYGDAPARIESESDRRAVQGRTDANVSSVVFSLSNNNNPIGRPHVPFSEEQLANFSENWVAWPLH